MSAIGLKISSTHGKVGCFQKTTTDTTVSGKHLNLLHPIQSLSLTYCPAWSFKAKGNKHLNEDKLWQQTSWVTPPLNEHLWPPLHPFHQSFIRASCLSAQHWTSSVMKWIQLGRCPYNRPGAHADLHHAGEAVTHWLFTQWALIGGRAKYERLLRTMQLKTWGEWEEGGVGGTSAHRCRLPALDGNWTEQVPSIILARGGDRRGEAWLWGTGTFGTTRLTSYSQIHFPACQRVNEAQCHCSTSLTHTDPGPVAALLVHCHVGAMLLKWRLQNMSPIVK